MLRLVATFIFICISLSTYSQNKSLNDFSFVVVPTDYEFLSRADQYQLNSMTKFYLEKAGFNVFMSNENPNTVVCDGLYAVVEKLPAFMMTKLQVTLNDCEGKEIYRGIEGKSKLKDFEKSYQDALRKAMSGLSSMRIQPKVMTKVPSKEIIDDASSSKAAKAPSDNTQIKTTMIAGKLMPSANFSNYTLNGRNFLLRKTQEGYSLYEEARGASEDLQLLGKIIILGETIKYMNDAGVVSEVSFDSQGNMTLQDGNTSKVYLLED